MQAQFKKVIALGLLLVAFSWLGTQSREQVKTIKALHRVFGKNASIEIDEHNWITVFADNKDFKVNDKDKARHVSDSLLTILKPIIGLQTALVNTMTFKSAEVVDYRKHRIHGGVWDRGIETVYEQGNYSGPWIDIQLPSIQFVYSFKGGFEMYSHIETQIADPKPPYVSESFLDNLTQNYIAEYNQEIYKEYMNSTTPDSLAYNKNMIYGKWVKDFTKSEMHDNQYYDYTFWLLIVRYGKGFDYVPCKLVYLIQFRNGLLIDIDPKTGKNLNEDGYSPFEKRFY
jgi:hypothetical protein